VTDHSATAYFPESGLGSKSLSERRQATPHSDRVSPAERGRQSPALFLYVFDKNQSKAQKSFRKLKNFVVAPSTFRHGK
jgi:hypothetical protein